MTCGLINHDRVTENEFFLFENVFLKMQLACLFISADQLPTSHGVWQRQIGVRETISAIVNYYALLVIRNQLQSWLKVYEIMATESQCIRIERQLLSTSA